MTNAEEPQKNMVEEKAILRDKGQLVIPKIIRDKADLKKGDILLFSRIREIVV